MSDAVVLCWSSQPLCWRTKIKVLAALEPCLVCRPFVWNRYLFVLSRGVYSVRLNSRCVTRGELNQCGGGVGGVIQPLEKSSLSHRTFAFGRRKKKRTESVPSHTQNPDSHVLNTSFPWSHGPCSDAGLQLEQIIFTERNTPPHGSRRASYVCVFFF